MPRIEFDGQGDHIPVIALPPFGSDGNLPPTTLTFLDNADFSVAEYTSLGFTHFEAWCVGGAGGRGGDATDQVMDVYTLTTQSVAQDVWNLFLEAVRIQDYFTAGNQWDHVYSFGTTGGPHGNGLMTAAEAAEWNNPSHQLQFHTTNQMVLLPMVKGMGGAGGGGGFQKVAGLLADLDDSISIVVGKAGADAGYGQVHQSGVWTPPLVTITLDPGAAYPRGRLNEINNYLQTYQNTYPLPHSSYGNPASGGDGGYSSFGEVAKASGGQGGFPGMVWDGTKFVVQGKGGDGGIGDRTLAGGGGAGSAVEGVNGSDGDWHPETGIGAGGGGGRGGQPSVTTGDPRLGNYVTTDHFATAGGQGSYSFGDTSVFGARQFRQAWAYLRPVVNTANGTVSYVPTTSNTALVIPGGGGGARPLGTVKAGSQATGYSPNGVVVIRLTRIT